MLPVGVKKLRLTSGYFDMAVLPGSLENKKGGR
jgi:hypothetical protein